MDRVEYFCYYDYCRLAYKYDLDILKLLNGDSNYSRYGGGGSRCMSRDFMEKKIIFVHAHFGMETIGVPVVKAIN